MDYLDYTGLPSGASVGWMADGVPGERVVFGTPTPLKPNAGPASRSVFINEWMAANSQSIADPSDGRYDDWIELFNAGTSPVDLAGYALSDSAADPRKFVFPAGTTIPSRGFIVVWADGEPWQSQPGGDQHASFRLDGNGEIIVLSGPDGTRLDYVAFGAQTPDLSEGRWPDGADAAPRTLTRPTLGTPNVWSSDMRIGRIALDANGQIEASWPSTTGQIFRVQFKDDLGSPAWSDLGQPIPAAGPETTVSLGVPSGGHRFFRIMVEGP